MLTLLPTTRVFAARGPTDLRKSFDGLSAEVRKILREDPVSGSLFVFCNRRRDRIRVLYWDGTGLWVAAKRLEKGTFAWPAADGKDRRWSLRSEELTLLLGGIDLAQTRPRKWYRRDKRSQRDVS